MIMVYLISRFNFQTTHVLVTIYCMYIWNNMKKIKTKKVTLINVLKSWMKLTANKQIK